MDDLAERSYRRFNLARIHDRAYELFVRANGFGISRMPDPSIERLRLDPLENIPFADQRRPDADRGVWRSSYYRGQTAADLPALHESSRFDFLDPDGLGAVLAPLERVAGFVAHAHRQPLQQVDDGGRRLAIERLELVSLHRFDAPRVYVLDHLPRMDQLSSENAPTRPLDEFEREALEQLETEDVVVREEGARSRMVGSLRAAQHCLDCHSVSRGELLGAFTYVIREAPAAN
jgi:hypothetical protein